MWRGKVKNNYVQHAVHAYVTPSDSVRETSSTATYFSSPPTDVSIYKEIEAMFRAHNTGSEATYTTYLVDTQLVAAATFTEFPYARDQSPDKLHNVQYLHSFVCSTSRLPRPLRDLFTRSKKYTKLETLHILFLPVRTTSPSNGSRAGRRFTYKNRIDINKI
jgi:hypothetical protein